MPERVLVVTGPTATGKTKLGVMLARDLDGEVVSADSMQVYRGMDIGTAKPAEEEKRSVRHHMLDVADPSEDFSVSKYADMAAACVDDILARGKVPVIVGGTGLYIDALVSGTEFAPPADMELRGRLNAEYDEIGGEAMLCRLARLDPERARKLHPADKKRIVRAIEICTLTGETMTARDARAKARTQRYDACVIALSFEDRQNLYDRIDARVDEMFENGLVVEVGVLLENGLTHGSTAMQAIGYKEVCLALNGEMSLDEAREIIKRGSRRYAKRQLTWLRAKKNVKWILWGPHPDFDFARRHSTFFYRSHVIE